jgi:hypothetical protein
MADITVQDASFAGVALSFGAAAEGDTIPMTASDRICLIVNNGSGDSINVTLTAETTSATVSGYGSVTLADAVVAVAAGAEKVIGPIPAAYINTATGKVAVAYSATTDVTRTVLKVGAAA